MGEVGFPRSFTLLRMLCGMCHGAFLETFWLCLAVTTRSNLTKNIDSFCASAICSIFYFQNKSSCFSYKNNCYFLGFFVEGKLR